MGILIKFFSFPASPIQRMGALGLASAALILLWTAIDWQIAEGFVRRSSYQVEMAMPDERIEAHRWQRDAAYPNTWRLLDEGCLSAKQDMLQTGNAEALENQSQARMRNCTRKELPGFTRSTSYKLTLREYAKAVATAGPYRRTYGSYASTAALLFALATFAYFGFMDRLFSWIRTGRL